MFGGRRCNFFTEHVGKRGKPFGVDGHLAIACHERGNESYDKVLRIGLTVWRHDQLKAQATNTVVQKEYSLCGLRGSLVMQRIGRSSVLELGAEVLDFFVKDRKVTVA